MGEVLPRTPANPPTCADLLRGGVVVVVFGVVKELLGPDASGEVAGEHLAGDAMDSQNRDILGRARRGLPRLRLCERPFQWNTPLGENAEAEFERKNGRVAAPLEPREWGSERKYSAYDGLFGGEIMEKSAVGAGLGGGGESVNLSRMVGSAPPASGRAWDGDGVGDATVTLMVVSIKGSWDGPACSMGSTPGAASGLGVELGV